MNALIVIVIVGGFAWFLLALPARRRSRAHVAMQDSIDVGDEVITAGGLHAVVRELGETELRIEIAPSVVVTLDRRAVAAVAVPEGEQETEQLGGEEQHSEAPPEPS
jgi:preprotein translocase subunit YajC